MRKIKDVIEAEDFGTIEIWSQDEIEYFAQDKEPKEYKDELKGKSNAY